MALNSLFSADVPLRNYSLTICYPGIGLLNLTPLRLHSMHQNYAIITTELL